MSSNFMDENFKGFNDLYEGQDVKGIVSIVKEDYVILDLGSAIEGKMYINEFTLDKNAKFTDLVKVGDTIEARINKISEEGTAIAYLSRKHFIEEENFEAVKKAFEKKQNINAKVIKVVNKGCIMEYNHVELFMHESQADTDNLNDLLGTTLEVEITNVDERNHRVQVSRSQVTYKEEKARRDREYHEMVEKRTKEADSLTVNKEVEMKVSELQDKFAIMEYGMNTAILPISNLDHHRYEKMSDLLKVGDIVKVKVMSNEVVKNRRRISVSRKALLPTPYQIFKEANPLGSVIETKVDKKLPFGMICDLATDVTGLVHVNEVSYNPNDNTMASLVHGSVIAVKIIGYNDKEEKISLSIKQLGSNPWASVTVSKGQIVNATVKEITPKGVTCEVQGVDAYLPTNDVANVDHITRAEDYVQVGQELEAKVVDVDRDRWFIKLSVKEMIQDQERREFDKYYASQEETVVTLGDLFGDKLKSFVKKEEKASKATTKTTKKTK